MKRITDLRADIDSKEARMKAIFDTAEKENRARNEAEKTEWAALKAEVANLRTELTDLEEQDEINRRAAKPVHAPAVHTEKRSMKDFSILRGIRLKYEGKELDGAEKDVHDLAVAEARKNGIAIEGFAVPAFLPKEERGQTVTGQTSATGDQGGLGVATEINSLIEALWEKNFLSEVGATRLAGLVGNQKFLVESTKPTAQEKTEIAELTDDEILFDDVDMAPTRRGVTVPISKQSIIQMSVDVQNLVMNAIRKALNKKLNQDAYTAIAAAVTTPNGNLHVLGASGAIAEYVDFVALETLVANANAEKVGMKYLTNTKVRGKAKTTQKFSTTNGDPVWERGNEINGYPTVISNIIPSNLTKGGSSGICSAIFFGNFEDVYVGMWGGMDFVVDPFTLAKKHSIQVTANMFWDVEIARALSLAGIKDALTA
jgi:HK97 family phage major capsid protein